MRHSYAGKRFGRRMSWRKATVRDIAKGTLISQRIVTTRSRAKEARKFVEKIITLGKKNTLAAKRRTFALLGDHTLVHKIFVQIAPLFLKRSGGYTRIIPLSEGRRGDNASLVILELTDKIPEVAPKAVSDKKHAKDVKAPEAKVDEKSVKKEPEASKKESSVHAHPEDKGKKDVPKKEMKPSGKITRGISKIFKKIPGE